MMRFPVLLLNLVLFLIPAVLQGQKADIPLGEWRIHTPYANGRLLCEVEDKIYAASEKGLFYVLKSNGEMVRLSRLDGLAESEVSALAYHPALKVLFVGYASSNIDLIIDGKQVVNMPDVYRKFLVGDKRFNHVMFSGDYAYVSFNFGIIVINLRKYEVTDSYLNIGPGGNSLQVNATAILNDSIYAATPSGLMKAKLNFNSMSDFNNWKFVVPGKNVRHLAAFNNRIVTEIDSAISYLSGDNLLTYTDASPLLKAKTASIGVNHGKLVIFRNGQSSVLETGGQRTDFGTADIFQGIIDWEGYPWYTVNNYGLIKKTPGGEISFVPNGPQTHRSYYMQGHGREMWVTGGNIANNWGPAFDYSGYYVFSDNEWFNRSSDTLVGGVYDFTSAVWNPVTSRMYLGTHSFGLYEFIGRQPVRRYDKRNSTLQQFGGFWTFVTGLAVDKKGNTWCANYGTDSALSVRTSSGKWRAFQLPTENTGQIVLDGSEQKWIVTPRSANYGICVFDDNKTPDFPNDDRSILLSKANGLPSTDVKCLAYDGSFIWVGTMEGLAYFPVPERVFNGQSQAEQIVIEQNGSTGYLLGNDVINCITVDGAGRKWIGTNSGAWLIGENGREIVTFFNKDNSPLPSNIVNAIGIVPETGEVFFGTEDGIVSYRGDATPGGDVHNNVKVFPNPVKPGFEGEVSISGLPENALVKITDILGNVVYETQAKGGTATWNVRTLKGEKVSTGVYMIFSANGDVTDTLMSKIMVVR